MSEIEAMHYCPVCERYTVHLFSGSGTKGSCMNCGHDLNPNIKVNKRRIIAVT